MQVPATEFIPVEELPQPQQGRSQASTDQLLRMRRDLEQQALLVQQLGKRISANNSGYLAKEAELTQKIREATDALEAKARGVGGSSTSGSVEANPHVAQASKLLEDAAVSQRQARIKELHAEIEQIRAQVDRRELDERLAATALQRLHQHIASLEGASEGRAEKLGVAVSEARALLATSFEHRSELAKSLDITLSPPRALCASEKNGTLEGQRIRGMASHSPGSRAADDTQREAPADEPSQEQQLARSSLAMAASSRELVSLVADTIRSLVEEGELRAAVYNHLEGANAELKQQLEGQSSVLLEAQEAMKRLHDELTELQSKVRHGEAGNEALLEQLERGGSVAALSERCVALEAERAAAQREVDAADRALEEAELESKIALNDQKLLTSQVADAEEAARRAKEQLDSAAAKRSELEAERAQLQRGLRSRGGDVAELEMQLQRAKAAAREREDDAEHTRARVRAVEAEIAAATEAVREAESAANGDAKLVEGKRAHKEALEKEIEEYKAKVADVRGAIAETNKKVEIERATVAVLEREVEEATSQLQYVRGLLPSTHPEEGAPSGSFNSGGDGRERRPRPATPAAASAPTAEQHSAAVGGWGHGRGGAGGDDPHEESAGAGHLNRAARIHELPPTVPVAHAMHSAPRDIDFDIAGAPGPQPAQRAAVGGDPSIGDRRVSLSPAPHASAADAAQARHGSEEGARSMAEINSKLSAIMSRRSSQRSSLAGSSVAPFQPPSSAF